MLDQITPLILTFNEEPNLEPTLRGVAWAKRLVIVDSGSTDRTLEMVQSRPGAAVIHRSFDSFADQCNAGLQHIPTPWVLSMDADYVVPPALVEEMATLKPTSEIAGYSARFRYCVFGRPLRSTLYPPRTVLYRVHLGRYKNEGHGHRVELQGRVLGLHTSIDHDDRKPLDRWFAAQLRYAAQEAALLEASSPGALNLPDRIRRRIWIAPWLVPLYCLFAKRLILDGWPGLYYVLQRTVAEVLLSLRLLDMRLRKGEGGRSEPQILRATPGRDQP